MWLPRPAPAVARPREGYTSCGIDKPGNSSRLPGFTTGYIHKIASTIRGQIDALLFETSVTQRCGVTPAEVQHLVVFTVQHTSLPANLCFRTAGSQVSGALKCLRIAGSQMPSFDSSPSVAFLSVDMLAPVSVATWARYSSRKGRGKTAFQRQIYS